MKRIVLSVLTFLMLFSCFNKKNDIKEGTDSIIKIGIAEPLNGDVSQYGNAIKDGIYLLLENVNQNGGINGKKIELVFYDTKGDLQETVNIAKKLVSQDKVDIILGEAISSNTYALAEIAQKAKVPMITPAGTRFDITYKKDYVFRTTFTDPYQGEVLAKYIEKLGYKNVALLTNSSSDYSVGVANGFKEEAKKLNLVFNEQKYTNDDKDFKSLLTNLKNLKADALLIPDYYNIVGLILSQAKELGIDMQFFGADGWDGVQTNFSDVAQGGIFLSQFDLEDKDELVIKFRNDFKQKYNKEPNLFNALGYDSALMLVEALSKVDDIKNSEKIKEELQNINMKLVTGQIKFDENRNPDKVVTVLILKDGKAILKDKF